MISLVVAHARRVVNAYFYNVFWSVAQVSDGLDRVYFVAWFEESE